MTPFQMRFIHYECIIAGGCVGNLSSLFGSRQCNWTNPEFFTKQSRLLTTLNKTALENTVGKGENAGYQHFLLYLQCFLLYHIEKLSFWQRSICCLQTSPNWSRPKFCRMVKGKDIHQPFLRTIPIIFLRTFVNLNVIQLLLI